MFIFLPFMLFAQETIPEKAGKTGPDVSDAWQQTAVLSLKEMAYEFRPFGKTFNAANPEKKFSAELSGNGMRIACFAGRGFTSYATKILSVGKSEFTQPVDTHSASRRRGAAIVFSYPGFDAEYVNDKTGLRQNFIVNEKPRGDDDLRVHLRIDGDLIPVEGATSSSVRLMNRDGKQVMHYEQLKVWDAANTPLEAVMAVNGREIIIKVEDEKAVYPVTIDPLTRPEEWVTSANGILPGLLTNLQLQADAVYGYEVYGIGDVNGDGYADAAIGAPGAIDVIAGPATIVGAGAVFIFFGSPAGFANTPDRVLRASTPVANALFGYSIAAGNVIGTGLNDIVVGAPGESYTTSVAGLPASATVTAGKVYVFNGQIISGASPYTSSSVFLEGAVNFSQGIFGVAASNLNANALFGFSVSTMPDINADGLSEVLVGAPGYADAGLVIARTGAAYMYLSSNISANSGTRLNSPALASFPALPITNLDGLLFGFSVDVAGDYNADGPLDVVVGAPGGINIGVNNFLGGSAYIFTGTTGGINTSASIRLQPATGLLGSVANLFGYHVKGLKNASGILNGNVIISAPSGQSLSNVLNGLRLKTGTLNVFTKKSSPGATETPVQSFSGPRGNNLLTILSAQNLDVSALFGSVVDVAGDIDCDGYSDIIVGEPLSTGVGIIGVNAVGGAAYIYRGRPDGTFTTTPFWSVENSVSFNAGVNAGSLLGYGVAGLGEVKGGGNGISILIGAPGAALDYGTGILQLGNTLATTFDFAAGDNGLGKGYLYSFNNCLVVPLKIENFNAISRNCKTTISWKLSNTADAETLAIEKSTDGRSFTQFVSAAVNEVQNSFERNETSSVSWYRAKLMMKSGTPTYSDAIKVSSSCAGENSINAYPTLFSNMINIDLNSISAKPNALLELRDSYGRLILSRKFNISAGVNKMQINGAHLPAGAYFVVVRDESYRSRTVKMVKQ